MAEYFGLQALEADYFLFLIQFEREGTARLREYFKRKLEKLKSDSRNLINCNEPKRIRTEEERAVFYSNPIYSVVRLYASTFQKTRPVRGEEILIALKARLIPRIGAEDPFVIFENEFSRQIGAGTTRQTGVIRHLNGGAVAARINGLFRSPNLESLFPRLGSGTCFKELAFSVTAVTIFGSLVLSKQIAGD